VLAELRIFKTKWLARFTRREGIDDQSLREAIERAEQGLIDADLGGGLIKQRVARSGRGRSGGYRMVVGYRLRERAVFLFGFAKNKRDNLEDDELLSLREKAEIWLTADGSRLQKELEIGNLQEIEDGEENERGGGSNS
jgi:hypothetical protein